MPVAVSIMLVLMLMARKILFHSDANRDSHNACADASGEEDTVSL